MFRSLRSRLVAAFALVIMLSLTLAGSAFVVMLRDYQAKLALNQLADVALPLSFQVGVLERSGSDSAEISRFLKEQAGELRIRVFLVDRRGVIAIDSEGQWQGQSIPVQSGIPFAPVRPGQWGVYRAPDGRELYYVSTGPRELRPRERPGEPNVKTSEAPPANVPSYGVVLAVPVASVGQSWLSLAPMLGAAFAIALLVSVIVAALLARSIARPVAEITRASERMAQGDYDQHIPEGGSDELAKLAASFNVMAREVARSHRTLKDFLINVSHELRTPLTSVQGFSQAVVDGTLQTPDEYADAGRIIQDESGRMRRLVEDLLELSRLESGQVAIAREAVDVGALVESMVKRASRWASDKGIAVITELTPLPHIVGDEIRIEQVVSNLLENAVKHTPPGGSISVRAHVTGRSGSADGAGVALEVHNSGSYIPPEQLPRIWERFYQVDGSRSGGGSGLGLAIAAEIVQAHGGKVSASSDLSTGTTFRVWLPLGPIGAESGQQAARTG
mgnify:CR=1 FL=1